MGGEVANKPAGFGVDCYGELYTTDMNGGEVFKVIPDSQFLGLGNALAGTNGKPILQGTGGVGAGEAGSLILSNAIANAPLAVLFIGLVEGAAPFKGGTLVPVPLLATISLFTDASGGLTIPWTDLGLASGTTVYFQYGIQDGAGPVGVSLSNELSATAP